MVNRSMQQKTLKLRKQRRAWAKPMSIVSGISPNKEVISGYKERAKGLALTDQEVDALYRRLYKRDPWKGDGPARRAVLDILQKRSELTPDFLFFSIVDNTFQRCRVYFNAQKTCYYLVHEDFRKRIVRTSLTCNNKERITTLWDTDRVTWVEQKPLPRENSSGF